MNTLTMNQRKWLLSLHIVFSGIMIGTAVVFLILTLTVINTTDTGVLAACYTCMHILARTSVRASTIGTVVTGVLLSVLTHWGLVKYYWIIAKEALTLVTIGIGFVGMYVWSSQGIALITGAGAEIMAAPELAANNRFLLMGLVLQIASLIGLFLLSVFKPWGKRKQRIA